MSASFDPTSTTGRRLRAGLFAVVAAQLAALGHLAGGGRVPDLSALLTTTAVIAPVAGTLARRRRRFPAILGVLVLAQVLFHLLFCLTGHGDHAMPMDSRSDPTSPRMLAFHLVAAALTALVLTCGEAAAFRLAALWRRLVRRTLVLVLPTPSGSRRPPRPPHVVTPAARRLTVRHPRRGPPVLLSF